MKTLSIIEAGGVAGGDGEGACLTSAAVGLSVALAPTLAAGALAAVAALGAAITCAQGQSGSDTSGGSDHTVIDDVDCSQLDF